MRTCKSDGALGDDPALLGPRAQEWGPSRGSHLVCTAFYH